MKTEAHFALGLAAVLNKLATDPPYWCSVQRRTDRRPRTPKQPKPRKAVKR